MSGELSIRPASREDIPAFHAHQLDREAQTMAGFTSAEPPTADATRERWERLLSDDSVTAHAILLDGNAIGHVASFVRDGHREVTYWLSRAHWGRGRATEALRRFLRVETTRPIHASAAADNAASRRVLEKCGFVETGRATAFAEARGREIEEVFFRHDGGAQKKGPPLKGTGPSP